MPICDVVLYLSAQNENHEVPPFFTFDTTIYFL